MKNSSQKSQDGRPYVLVTAAYNEEALIESLIASVISQSVLPLKWVIVSDGSTDRTDEIVLDYTKLHSFIELLRIAEDHPRNFEAQANAINAGVARLTRLGYDYIGNVDSDISFGQSYFERLIDRFENDPSLGLAGGFIHEECNGKFQSRKSNRTQSVAHAVQLFRRSCFEAIGSHYLPLPYGGPDWHAEVSARMKGWRVQAFPELRVLHHRPTGTAGGLLRYCFRQGLMDYSLGVHPLFEIAKLLPRFMSQPYVLGGLLRLVGFACGYCRGEKRLVSNEFVEFLRGEQVERLKSLCRSQFSSH